MLKVAQADSDKAAPRTLVLKDPALAAFLAWLVPGLGHLYQGRIAKGVLFFVCLMGTFAYGCYLGSSNEAIAKGSNVQVGYARVVYVSWRDEDQRLPYLCQVCIGLPALPALVQANRAHNGNPPLGSFMAPPKPDGGTDPFAEALKHQPTLDDLNRNLANYFELGTLYTMVAGLLNVLVIYDAWGGPVFPEEKESEKEDDKESAKEDDKDGAKKTDAA
jgi:hypothetical protein